MTDPFEYHDLIALLNSSSSLDEEAWLFLPTKGILSQKTPAFVAILEEVPPQRESERDAGIPAAALLAGYRPKLPVASVQDIVINAKTQRENAKNSDIFSAFIYYLEFDAFINFSKHLRA
jgi:hypothetical protein